jgi:hypothetical protein
MPMHEGRMILGTIAVLALVACAGRSSVPIGPGRVVEVKLQPAYVPPDARGALAIGVVTGCQVEYIGKTDRPQTHSFLVQPSERVPDFDRCISLLRVQPGIEEVTVR